jgi:hypothetical protein
MLPTDLFITSQRPIDAAAKHRAASLGARNVLRLASSRRDRLDGAWGCENATSVLPPHASPGAADYPEPLSPLPRKLSGSETWSHGLSEDLISKIATC